MSAPGGCLVWGCLLLGGCLLGGVCSWGVSAPGGCLLSGVSAPRGSARGGGVCLLPGGGGVCSGGVCSWGGIPACSEADPPLLTESQTPVKTLPCPNFVAGGNERN